MKNMHRQRTRRQGKCWVAPSRARRARMRPARAGRPRSWRKQRYALFRSAPRLSSALASRARRMQAYFPCRRVAASVPATAMRPAGRGSGTPASTPKPKRWRGARRAQLLLPRSLVVASLDQDFAVGVIIISDLTDQAIAVFLSKNQVAKPRTGGHGTRD